MTTISEERAAAVARWAVLVAIAGTALVVVRPLAEPFALPKATLAGLCAIVGVGAVAWRSVLNRRLAVPFASALAAAGVFLALGAVAVVTSDVVWRSSFGQRDRATGYGLYLVCGLLLVLTVLAFAADVGRLRLVARAGVVAAGGVAGYCLLQQRGLDPLSWPAGALPMFSTIGNSNGVSGYLGAALPLAAYVGVADTDRRWRLAGIATACAAVLSVVLTRSFQGIPAGIAGMALLAATWLPMAAPTLRRWALGGLAAAVGLSAVVVVAGLAGTGPFQNLSGEVGFAQRQYYWAAALSMTVDEPVVGVGFDSYGNVYRQHRSAEAAGRFGLTDTADEPHNVALAMFSGGGFPLGLAYLAFVLTVGLALFRGLRVQQGDRRLLLGAVGGAWLGYQVQSLVSVETPAAAVLHWVMAGAVLLAAGALSWSYRGEPLPDPGAKRKQPRRSPPRPPTGATYAKLAAIVVVCSLLMWWVTIPARADRHAQLAATTTDLFTADKELRSAIDIAPWESGYWFEQGKLLAGNGQPTEALAIFEKAVGRERTSFVNVLNAARYAHAAEKEDTAEDRYLMALEIEPYEPNLKAEIGAFYLDIGRPDDALPLLRQALPGTTDQLTARIDLGRALLATGAVEGALESFSSAMALQPDDPLLAQKVAAYLADGGEPTSAIEVLRTFLEGHDPPDAKTMALLGELLLGTSDREEGIALLEQAHEQLPQDAAITAALDRAHAQG